MVIDVYSKHNFEVNKANMKLTWACNINLIKKTA